MLGLETYQIWLVVGLSLAILEVWIPGVFVIFWGIGAIITGTVLSFMDLSFNSSMLLFVVSSLVLCIATKIIWKKKDKPININNRLKNMIGSIGVVELVDKGRYRAKIGDTTWEIKTKGEPLLVGDQITVIGIENEKLVVKKSIQEVKSEEIKSLG